MRTAFHRIVFFMCVLSAFFAYTSVSAVESSDPLDDIELFQTTWSGSSQEIWCDFKTVEGLEIEDFVMQIKPLEDGYACRFTLKPTPAFSLPVHLEKVHVFVELRNSGPKRMENKIISEIWYSHDGQSNKGWTQRTTTTTGTLTLTKHVVVDQDRTPNLYQFTDQANLYSVGFPVKLGW